MENRKEPLAEVAFTNAGPLLAVPVTIHGKTLSFVFDTGCNALLIDEKHRSLLGEHIETEEATTAATKVKVPLFEAPTMKCGEIELDTERGVGCLDLSKLSQGAKTEIDGILGTGALRRHIVQLDFEQNKLRFLTAAKESDEAFPFQGTLEDSPTVFLKLFPPAEEPILVDTGFHGGVGLNRFGFRWLVGEDRMRPCGLQTVATAGGEVYRRIGMIDEVCIGNVVLKDVSAQVSPIAIIGLDCLRRFTVTLDFPGRRVLLERNNRPDVPIEFPEAELDIVQDGAAFRVHGICPLSAEIRGGVELDDRILVINGQEIAGMDLNAVKQRLRDAREPKALVVERSGKRVDLVIRLLDEHSSK